MNRFLLIILGPICAVLFLILAIPSHALTGWEFITTDARSFAMAGTDLAAASGATANALNAAPLHSGRNIQYSYTYRDEIESPPDYRSQFGNRNFVNHALALEYKGFRASYSYADMIWDGDCPEEYSLYRQYLASQDIRINVVGLSYDLSRLVAADSESFTWIAGVNHRRFRYGESWDGTSAARMWNMDFGTTACWSLIRPSSRLDFIGTITGCDILGVNHKDEAFGPYMPKMLRFGSTVRAQAFFDGAWFRSCEFSLAFLRNHHSERSTGWLNGTNLGTEIVFSDVVVLRAGANNSPWITSKKVSYGAGLRTPGWLFENFGLSVDYAAYEFGNVRYLTVGGWANF